LDTKKERYKLLIDCKNTAIIFCKQLENFGIQNKIEGNSEDSFNINLVENLIKTVKLTKKSLGKGEFAPVKYESIYILKDSVTNQDKELRAKIVKRTEGFIKSDVVDIKWKGGSIANKLNSDHTLKEMLLGDTAYPFYIANSILIPDQKRSEEVLVNSLRDELLSNSSFRKEWRLMRRVEKFEITSEEYVGIKVNYREFTSPVPSRQLMDSILRIGSNIKEMEK
jgi:hypothetical protein